MKNLYVILVRPQVPENIGFSIRVCANFKVENLFIVAPENFDMNRIKRTATQIGSKLIDKMRL
ncbi:MAG: TrmH family RNA methyltransferase, partial [candidate division WOR-3 bacterium]